MSDYKLNNSDSAVNEASSVSFSDAEETFFEGPWQLNFEGKGSELFGIFIDNFFLNLLTLGIYYPWAKAKQLRYYYSSTSINNSDLQFSGSGKEMFFGLAKALLVLFFLNFAYETFIAGMDLDWMLLIEIENIFLMRLIKFLTFGNKK